MLEGLASSKQIFPSEEQFNPLFGHGPSFQHSGSELVLSLELSSLAAANKVIIFDSSFNPQDDIQVLYMKPAHPSTPKANKCCRQRTEVIGLDRPERLR